MTPKDAPNRRGASSPAHIPLPPIHLVTGSGPARLIRLFAGGDLITDRDSGALKGLPRVSPASDTAPGAPAGSAVEGRPDDLEPPHLPALFDGLGWVAGETRRVACRGGGDRFHIEVEDHSRLRVERRADRVDVVLTWLAERTDVNLDAIVSAPVVLGLALSSRYCLHASAVAYGDRAWVFPGDSDAGKSTIARGIGALPGWRRLTDDISPVAVDADGAPWLLPHFTQPRLDADEHPGPADGQVRIAGIGLLDARDDADAVRLVPLSGPEATMDLVRHTVGTRVFDSHLRRDHLAACAAIGAAVPVVRLVYPRRLAALPGVADTLLARLRDPRTISDPGAQKTDPDAGDSGPAPRSYGEVP